MSRSGLYLRDLSGAAIRTEVVTDGKRRIDILITIPGDEKNRKQLIVAVEAKINAKESINQTLNYFFWIKSKYHSESDHLFVFLTKQNEESAQSKDFVQITWDILYRRFSQISKTKRGLMAPEMLMVLEHYLRHLEREQLVQNEETENHRKAKEIAMDLYSRHKDALDFISENISKNGSEILGALRSCFETDSDLKPWGALMADAHCLSSRFRFYPFVVKKRSEPSQVKGLTKPKQPIYIQISIESKGIAMFLVVGDMEDSDLRQPLISKLRDCLGSDRTSNQSQQGNSKETRVIPTIWLRKESDIVHEDLDATINMTIVELKKSIVWRNRDQIADIIIESLPDQFEKIKATERLHFVQD